MDYPEASYHAHRSQYEQRYRKADRFDDQFDLNVVQSPRHRQPLTTAGFQPQWETPSSFPPPEPNGPKRPPQRPPRPADHGGGMLEVPPFEVGQVGQQLAHTSIDPNISRYHPKPHQKGVAESQTIVTAQYPWKDTGRHIDPDLFYRPPYRGDGVPPNTPIEICHPEIRANDRREPLHHSRSNRHRFDDDSRSASSRGSTVTPSELSPPPGYGRLGLSGYVAPNTPHAQIQASRFPGGVIHHEGYTGRARTWERNRRPPEYRDDDRDCYARPRRPRSQLSSSERYQRNSSYYPQQGQALVVAQTSMRPDPRTPGSLERERRPYRGTRYY